VNKGIGRESNPYFLVHSQACRNRYTTDTMRDDQCSNDQSEIHCVTPSRRPTLSSTG
jgi:hypothetical protein